MPPACAAHRPYLAAIADGEFRLVPDATREHVAECATCGAEVATLALVGEKLRVAIGNPVDLARSSRRRLHRPRVWLAAAAAALMLVGGITAWRLTQTSSDPIAVALAASVRPTMFASNDPNAIAGWCSRAWHSRPPAVWIPSLTPVGARWDSSDGTKVLTVFYVTQSGHRVNVGWLEASMAAAETASVQSKTASGVTTLELTTRGGEAVISGPAPRSVLWTTASYLASASG
jgi:hypothetical protein